MINLLLNVSRANLFAIYLFVAWLLWCFFVVIVLFCFFFFKSNLKKNVDSFLLHFINFFLLNSALFTETSIIIALILKIYERCL